MAKLFQLSAADKKHFIALAKTKPVGKDGRVFVGDGRFRNSNLDRYFGSPLYGDAYDQDGNYAGSGDFDYYIPRFKWTKLFGAANYPDKTMATTNKTAVKKAAAKKVVKKKVAAKRTTTNKDVRVPVTRTLAQAHAAALAAADERIVLSDGKISVLSDDIYTSFSWEKIESELGVGDDRYLPLDVAIAKKILAAGSPVIWSYTYDNGTYRFVGFNGEFGEVKLAPKPIVVNGETGEDKGDYWKFGCANIAKADLRQARRFLLESSTYFKSTHANRKIEGVMIGKGFFTLEILDRMNLVDMVDKI